MEAACPAACLPVSTSALPPPGTALVDTPYHVSYNQQGIKTGKPREDKQQPSTLRTMHFSVAILALFQRFLGLTTCPRYRLPNWLLLNI